MTDLVHTHLSISSTSSGDLVMYVVGQSPSFARSDEKANPDITVLDEGVLGFSRGFLSGTN